MRGKQIGDGYEPDDEGLYWSPRRNGTKRFELWLDGGPHVGLCRDGFFETEEGAKDEEIESFLALWIGKVAARIGRAVRGCE